MSNAVKLYVRSTGAVFGLVTLVHIWRAIAEPNLAKDVGYILLTVAVAAFSLWAAGLLGRVPRS